jgi:ParB family chromosome partitioning protein
MIRNDSRKALGKGLSSLLPPRPAATLERTVEAPGRAPEVPGERILRVPVAQVRPNPNQPRGDFDEAALNELTASVARDGILQPIVARRAAPDRYEIIAGERRWRAAQRAGLAEIPVILRDADENRSLELALIENIQREDLNPIELARAFERMTELGLRHDEIGEKTGKERTTVTNALRLLQLPDEVQAMVASRRLSAGHARAILKIESGEKQKEIAQRCMAEGWSVRQIEDYTRPDSKAVPVQSGGAAAAAAPARQPDANVRAAQSELEDVFGTKVRIVSTGRGRGRIEIEYYSQEDLQRLFELLTAK